MVRKASGLLVLIFLGLVSCGQDYNSNSNDNGGELGIDCTVAPELCLAYIAIRKNHCFECHAYSDYRTDAAWVAAGLVIANDPDNSLLVKKLKNAGGNMPQNYNPMTNSEFNAVKTWIQNM